MFLAQFFAVALSVLFALFQEQAPPPGQEGGTGEPPTEESLTPHGVLVIVLDDVGTQWIECYQEWTDHRPRTPTFDGLATSGTLFKRFYGAPTCTPFRSQLLGGRSPRDYGVTFAINHQPGHPNHIPFPAGEYTWPHALRAHPTAPPGGAHSAWVGKWHLGELSGDAEEAFYDPAIHGLTIFSGTTADAPDRSNWSHRLVGGPPFWELRNDSETQHSNEKATDDAIALIEAFKDLSQPWALVLSYHYNHKPTEWAPEHSYNEFNATDLDKYGSMIEYLDTQTSRVLEHLSPTHDTVFVIGDNGCAPEYLQSAPFGKGSVREGGVRVPCIAWGRGVPTQINFEMACVADLPPTICDLLQISWSPPQSSYGQSLTPMLHTDPAQRSGIHDVLYQEVWKPTTEPYMKYQQAAIMKDYKVIIDRVNGHTSFHRINHSDLNNEGTDVQPVGAEVLIKANLIQQLEALHDGGS